MESISAKLNEVANKKEPVIAFRGAGVKDSGASSKQSVSKYGEFWIISYNMKNVLPGNIIWHDLQF